MRIDSFLGNGRLKKIEKQRQKVNTNGKLKREGKKKKCTIQKEVRKKANKIIEKDKFKRIRKKICIITVKRKRKSKARHTLSCTDLDQGSETIILESICFIFEASSFF